MSKEDLVDLQDPVLAELNIELNDHLDRVVDGRLEAEAKPYVGKYFQLGIEADMNRFESQLMEMTLLCRLIFAK